MPWAKLIEETENTESGVQACAPFSQYPGLHTQVLPTKVRVLGHEMQLSAEPLHPRHLLLQVAQTLTPVS
jgi:hypothetical protein